MTPRTADLPARHLGKLPPPRLTTLDVPPPFLPPPGVLFAHYAHTLEPFFLCLCQSLVELVFFGRKFALIHLTLTFRQSPSFSQKLAAGLFICINIPTLRSS